ncbi:uncharacterized protein PIG-G isoform X2 [Lepeophtheirus salmonis]|uniref:uncharacterized protein PIG-G isoform X2 n=2 Tax=Lepeophtheirus salmonis TaxID=72036 RepID=UPI001AEA4897|nr:GPI ethanolamine phosphate transferase 2-like isoform X2 [Lepeophtheirus salmonis]
MKMILKLVMFWIQILGFLWFLLGFFPLKTPLKGDAPSIREEEEEFPSLSLAWKRRVGQVVIVVVDALRADFVFNKTTLESMGLSNDDFMLKRADSDKRLFDIKSYSTFTSLGLVARVSCPTVTLPRIKAISTGSIPGYVDVVINFDSAALMEDSLIKRWRDASRNIVYYGDDTWIKLFPDSFLRNEGTSSFFVSDFHQVDDNVTRNLPHEFEKSDWDVMILHYLGLDHIGHVFGPTSSLIPSKLTEMEDVIEKLIVDLEKKGWKDDFPPLILVLGDHGMADIGGHGGSTIPETITPVIALSPIFNASQSLGSSKVIQQTDLAVTLSWLTGVSIPKNSMGTLVDGIVSSVEVNPVYQKLSALYNLKQIYRIVEQNSLNDQIGSNHEIFFNGVKSQNQSMREVLAYVEFVQTVLFDNVLEYNYVYMILGCGSIFTTVVILLVKSLTYEIFIRSKVILMFHLLRLLSLASTSFIEEEHQVSYFLTMTLFMTMDPSFELLVVMLAYRGARTLNQTGDKWAHLPDVSDWLNNHGYIRSSLFLFSIMGLWVLRARQEGIILIDKLSSIVLMVCVVSQKIADNSVLTDIIPISHIFSERGVYEAQIVYLGCVVIACVKAIIYKKTSRTNDGHAIFEVLMDSFIPLICVLNRAENVCLIFLSVYAESVIWSKIKDNTNGFKSALLYYMFGLCAFFHQGNSTSSLSKVDVNRGYIGISSFNSITVGSLLMISTYSGPLLWLILLYKRLDKTHHKYSLDASILLLGVEAVFFMIIITAQRFHLFIWTVFSPKLLYLSVNYFLFTVMHSFLSLCIYGFNSL